MLHCRFATNVLLISCLTGISLAQPGSSTANATTVTPETGFISPAKYTNAFFGFALPLPQNVPLGGMSLRPKSGPVHFLFGVQAQRNGLAVLTVTAKAEGSVPDGARGAASGPKHLSTKRVEIGGREFWKGESQEKAAGGKMRGLGFATSNSGYVLQFDVVSFDAKLGDELQRSIESITFFDPSKAEEVAGPDCHPYNSAPQSSSASSAPILTSKRIGNLDLGTISGNTYTNQTLGFSYDFPAGWVTTDKETQEKVIETGHEAMWGNDPGAAREHEVMEQCTRRLLWVSKYPEGTKTDEVNPLIAILVLDPSCGGADLQFPKSAEDRNAIRQIGEQFVGSMLGSHGVRNQKIGFGAHDAGGRLVISVSYSFTVDAPKSKSLHEVFTAFAITTAKDYWVAWMFMSGSQSDLDQVKKGNVRFLPQ